MHCLNKNFDKIYCISLLDNPDRRKKMEDKFDELGIEVEFFDAVKYGFAGKITTLLKQANHDFVYPNEYGCMHSHYTIIKMAKEQGLKNVFIFEDDNVFRKDFNQTIESYIDVLPNDWDMFYLYSMFYEWNEKHKFVVPNMIFRNYETHCANAYAVNGKYFDKILNSIDDDPRIIDSLYRIMQRDEKNKIYSVFPNLCSQDFSKSNLRGGIGNYFGKIVSFGDYGEHDFDITSLSEVTRPPIKIWFSDFWPSWNNVNNPFINLLKPYFDITITPDDPDLLIYTVFGNNNTQYKNCKRLRWIGESWPKSIVPNEFVISFDHDRMEDTHLRFPLWKFFLYDLYPQGIKELANKKISIDKKDNFCAFFASASSGFRDSFFQKLSKYKRVDSYGFRFNNKPEGLRDKSQGNNGLNWWYEKQEILQKNPYKFVICMENSLKPGYTTEKLVDAMVSGSIPIYWGDPEVARDFNTKSFIYVNEYDTVDDAIDKIKELDTNDDLYYKMLREPWVTQEQRKRLLINQLEKFLIKIIEK